MVFDFDKSLTLGELVDKLEPNEGIIAEFPNGYKRFLSIHSRLSESDAALPIVKTYKYDCGCNTYYVKVSTLEMYLRPSKTETYEIEPITLNGIFRDLGRDEKMIIHFPNGLTKSFNYWARFNKYFDNEFIVKSCEYDCPSKTYYVTVEKKEDDKLTIKPENSYYGINPISQMKNIREWYGMLYDKYIKIEKVIHSGPATIIFWDDGTKTVVKAQDEFDYEKGILYAALKKLATKKEYDNILRAIDKVDEARKDEPVETEKKETPKKKREYKYQKCPVCGRGYNLNYYRTNKLSKQGFVDIRCPGCDTLFRVKGDWNLPNWHTKLEHDVLIKGGKRK